MVQASRYFVIGCGSIGRRHIKNLQALGVSDILAFDVQARRRSEVESQFDIPTVATLEDGWSRDANVALITTPTNLHIPLALQAANHKCHLFIEKPLGHSLEGADELISVVQKYQLTTMVACNMRFQHGPATIKRLLDKRAIGKIVTAHLDSGQYLPDWHPWEDYRTGYSANSSMGGGVILDGIHEIDYARWLFGEVTEVYCQGGKISSLEIDTEDTADILMKMARGFSVSIHMDYIQRTYWRTCKIVGEEGTIYWDIKDGDVRLFSAANDSWSVFPAPECYDINQMYIDEMKHFISCIDNKEQSVQSISEAKRTLEITLAIKDSMLSGEKRGLAA